MAWQYLGEALYPPGHPYRHTAIGSHEDLTAATLDDVRAFFQQYYVPANAVLAVVGDFDEKSIKAQIERYFGPVPGGERSAAPSVKTPEPRAIHWQEEDDVPLPRVYLAWHTPALFADGDAELDLLSSVLTDGKVSRLYRPLVYDGKIAKDVTAFQVSQKLSSFYVIQATAAPGQSVDALYEGLRAATASALRTEPAPEELARAVSGYKKSFYRRIEDVQSRASTLTSYFLHTGRADYIQQDMQRYTQATARGVHAAARRYLDLERAVRIDILPRRSKETK
jgi:zinc protease